MEENKARETLTELLSVLRYEKGTHIYCREIAKRIADAILQSPDLRVTLVEPKYKVAASGGDWEVYGGRFSPRWGAKFQKREHADEYAEWLNSKEPK